MDANSLILALASQPGFLPVREDQAGETRDITGVDRRLGEDGEEYLVLLSAPRSKPETAPAAEPTQTPAKLRPGLRETS